MYKIIFHQRLIPHYQIGIMRRFCDKFMNTTVLYGNEKPSENLSNAIFTDKRFIRVRNYYPFNSVSTFWSNIFGLIFKLRPEVIITQGNVGNLNLLILFILRIFYDYKIVLWGHGWNRRKGFNPRKSFADKWRLLLQRKSDAIILYSNLSKVKLLDHLAAEKIFVANNTIDTIQLTGYYNLFSSLGMGNIKRIRNIKFPYNLVFLGRLIKQRNLIMLLHLLKEMNNPNIALHIIGDGETEGELKDYCSKKNLNNVVFYGQISDDKFIGEILFCCDLMIIPRAAGLSIIHSFIFGLPVAVLENVENGPEVDFIKHDENGFLLFNNSLIEIADILQGYLRDISMQRKMKEEARKVIDSEVNTEQFLFEFGNAINYALSK